MNNVYDDIENANDAWYMMNNLYDDIGYAYDV
jgi:hypothetical protein